MSCSALASLTTFLASRFTPAEFLALLRLNFADDAYAVLADSVDPGQFYAHAAHALDQRGLFHEQRFFRTLERHRPRFAADITALEEAFHDPCGRAPTQPASASDRAPPTSAVTRLIIGKATCWEDFTLDANDADVRLDELKARNISIGVSGQSTHRPR